MRQMIATLSLVLALFAGSARAQTTFTGTVVDSGGIGIGGLDLDLFDSGGSSLPLTGATTLADGTFSFQTIGAIPNGSYTVGAGPDLAGPLPIPEFIPGFYPPVQVLIPVVSLGTLVLEVGHYFTGFVLDDLGVGIEQVDLDFTPPGSSTPIVVSQDFTDAFGFFSVQVPDGTYNVVYRILPVVPCTEGYVPVLTRNVVISGADVDAGNIALHDGYLITGTVQDSLGQPINGADIDVRDPITNDKIYTLDDNTDATGAFCVRAPVGSWNIEVDPPLGALLVTQVSPLTLTTLGADTGIIALPGGFVVSGQTVDSSGTPVPDVDLDFAISASGLDIPTAHDNADSSGNFAVVVEADTYDIAFRPQFVTGLAPTQMQSVLVSGATGLGSVTLPQGFAISGNVTDDTGAPVAGTMISVTDSLTGLPVYSFSNDTDVVGNYAFREAAGTYDLTFTPPLGLGVQALVLTNQVLSADLTVDAVLPPDSSGPAPFIRGDANRDGSLDISDTIKILSYLFQSGTVTCEDAADVNDSSAIDIADAIYLLSFLFSGGPDPLTPHPGAGSDPTADSLDCFL